MLAAAVAIWVFGLFTAVPYAACDLLYYAPREQYALLITFILFWIFGYWGVVGTLLAVVKVRRVFRAIEGAKSKDELMKALRSDASREVAIDFIATDNHIPRFLARRVYGLLVARLSTRDRGEGGDRRERHHAAIAEGQRSNKI